LEGVSGGEHVYLKSPDGGQWGELTLRRATNDEKRRSGIKPDKWIAVIAVEGNSKLTLQALVDQLRPAAGNSGRLHDALPKRRNRVACGH